MKKYWGGIWLFDAGAWAYHLFTSNPVWLANCARLLAHVPPQQDQLCVLDLGVGPGGSALAMGQQRSTARFVGLDLAQRMLAVAARNRFKSDWPAERLPLVRGDALHLPLADKKVDAVTGHSLLYLLPDHQLALNEANRVLRPGGYAAFLEPHTGRVSWPWLWSQPSSRLWVSVTLWRFYSGLHRRFSPESMRRSLAQAGFVNISTEVTLGGFGIFGRAQKP
jgi:ubiquinone/menaquinone biosynthesis C-methylase UbiE